MAKPTKPTEKETKTAAAPPAVVEQGALTTIPDDMFAADAGSGMEGATSESFAIPFLSVLQKISPQCDEADGAYVEGAKAGMFFENVNNTLHDGKAGILVVPCAYRRVFLRWGPRGEGGAGFKGELLPEVVAQMRAEGQIVDLDGRLYVPLPDGTINDKKCDRISDTRNHYVLLLDGDTGAWTTALLSLTSTQIKKSKMLMSSLASVKLKGPHGLYTPPTFASVVRVTSVPESNDKGSWMGMKFEIAHRVAQPEVYAAAKAFHASVAAGVVEAKYEAPAATPDADGKF